MNAGNANNVGNAAPAAGKPNENPELNARQQAKAHARPMNQFPGYENLYPGAAPCRPPTLPQQQGNMPGYMLVPSQPTNPMMLPNQQQNQMPGMLPMQHQGNTNAFGNNPAMMQQMWYQQAMQNQAMLQNQAAMQAFAGQTPNPNMLMGQAPLHMAQASPNTAANHGAKAEPKDDPNDQSWD